MINELNKAFQIDGVCLLMFVYDTAILEREKTLGRRHWLSEAVGDTWDDDATHGFPHNDVRGTIPELHTDDVSLPRSGQCLGLAENYLLKLGLRRNTAIWRIVSEDAENMLQWCRYQGHFKKGRPTLAIGYFHDASSVCLKGYRTDFHFGMSFVPEWSWFCIHMVKSTGSA